MKLRFTNGTIVSRLYSDDTPELIAGFQYDTDAEEFAKLCLQKDAVRNWFDNSYLIVNCGNGKSKIVRHGQDEKQEGGE